MLKDNINIVDLKNNVNIRVNLKEKDLRFNLKGNLFIRVITSILSDISFIKVKLVLKEKETLAFIS